MGCYRPDLWSWLYAARRLYHGNTVRRDCSRDCHEHVVERYGGRINAGFGGRNVGYRNRNRCNHLDLDEHCKLENHAQRLRRRHCHGFNLPFCRCKSTPMVRTCRVGRLLFRCCLHGNRPCYFCKNGKRQVDLRLLGWRHGCYHSGIEPRLP